MSMVKPEPLQITKVTMTTDGRLILMFSKDVLWPKINLGGVNSPAKRALKAQYSYRIEELVSMKLQDNGTGDPKNLRNTNFNVTLESYDSRSL